MNLQSLTCPGCGQKIWIRLQPSEDLTTPDNEAVECVWCEKVFGLWEFEGWGDKDDFTDSEDPEDWTVADSYRCAAQASGEEE